MQCSMDDGGAHLSENDKNKYNKCTGKHWFIAAVGLCFYIETVAIICTLSYERTYDESDSHLAIVSGILLIIGFVGQTIGCCGVSMIAVKVQECGESCKDQQGNDLCLVCLLLLIISVFGPLQLIASLLMMFNNTENDAANVKVFGAYIIIMDLIATILSVVYGVGILVWAFCCQDNSRKENIILQTGYKSTDIY